MTGAPESALRFSSVAPFLLLALALWLALFPYAGITHDAIIYSMQGLAHLRPDLYGGDLFIRYGSQDRYSLYGTAYALAIRTFGLEHAAALLTVVFQALLIASAWVFARRLMNTGQALLAALLPLTINPVYGSRGIFHVVEPFATPRPLAEALVLLGLAALLGQRDRLALLLCLCAALFHPIMACAGFGVMLWIRLVLPHPVSASLWLAMMLAALLIAAWCMPPTLRIDDAWFQSILGFASYLQLHDWSPVEWERFAVMASTLIIGCVVFDDPRARAISGAALAVAVAGLLLTAILTDWARLQYLTQAQFWRCEWLGYTVSTVLLPPLCTRLWHLRAPGRTTLALLAAAYCLEDSFSCIAVGGMAIVAAVASVRPQFNVTPRMQQPLLLGALAVLLIGIVWNALNGALSWHAPLAHPAGPAFAAFRGLAAGSLIAPLMLTAIWWLALQCRSRAVPAAMMIAAGIALWLLLPTAWTAWKRVTYSPELINLFAPWRAKIPVGTEILYVGTPIELWMLLQRPSYINGLDRAAAVFSHEAADVMRQRLEQYDAVEDVNAGGDLKLADSMGLDELCARSTVRFYMTHQVLDAKPVETLTTDAARFGKGLKVYLPGLKLYECAERSGG